MILHNPKAIILLIIGVIVVAALLWAIVYRVAGPSCLRLRTPMIAGELKSDRLTDPCSGILSPLPTPIRRRQ